MHLRLITGFLGSGKTSLVIALARAASHRGRQVAVVVNEIGEIGIDNQLMRQLDLDVWEVVNGCICCTLSADLIATLEKLDASYAPDLVVVEPSGAANPGALLATLPFYKGRPLASVRTAVVLDPLRLPVLLEVLTPLIHSGIERADCILIGKADLASAEALREAARSAREINPHARLFTVSLKDELAPEVVGELLPWTS